MIVALLFSVVPASAALLDVDASSQVVFTGPGFGFPGFFIPGTSDPQSYPATFAVQGSLDAELDSSDGTSSVWTVTSFRLGADTNADGDAFQTVDAVLESWPYDTIEALSGFDLSNNLGEPGAAVLTLNGAAGTFEIRGAAGTYEGPGLYGGDSSTSTLIAGGTFTGSLTAPTGFTVTNGFGWIAQAVSDPGTSLSLSGGAPPPVATGQIPVQGALTDAGGLPLSGTRAVTFNLWADDAASSPVWTGVVEVAFVDGAFSAWLGGVDAPLPLSLFGSHPALVLSTDVPGLGESPRVAVGWAPRAAYAHDAGSLGGAPASAFLTGADTAALITDRFATASYPTPTSSGQAVPLGYLQTALANLSSSSGTFSGDLKAARVGVGLGGSAPARPLDVSGSALSVGFTSPGGQTRLILGNRDSAAIPSVIAADNGNLRFGRGSSYASADGGTFTETAQFAANGTITLGRDTANGGPTVGSVRATRSAILGRSFMANQDTVYPLFTDAELTSAGTFLLTVSTRSSSTTGRGKVAQFAISVHISGGHSGAVVSSTPLGGEHSASAFVTSGSGAANTLTVKAHNPIGGRWEVAVVQRHGEPQLLNYSVQAYSE
jgi:hypothetical protein